MRQVCHILTFKSTIQNIVSEVGFTTEIYKNWEARTGIHKASQTWDFSIHRFVKTSLSIIVLFFGQSSCFVLIIESYVWKGIIIGINYLACTKIKVSAVNDIVEIKLRNLSILRCLVNTRLGTLTFPLV